jgi:hypothetical protein
MPNSPGTVSKILWHFTGGAVRNEEDYRPTKELKSTEDAYKAVVGILKSKQIRLASCPERIDVIRTVMRSIGDASDAIKKRPVAALVDPVCCLADIPIIHLQFHSGRYGELAIGFHRGSVVNAGFTPVFYQLQDSDIARAIVNIIDGFDILASLEPNAHLPPEKEKAEKPNETIQEQAIRVRWNTIVAARKDACLLASYLKTFEPTEFDSIYCEREWRSTLPFRFGYDDVAMIVVPKKGQYFQRLCEESATIGLPKSIPIVPWEDLVEH